jgi:DegV family protein with EDD domain
MVRRAGGRAGGEAGQALDEAAELARGVAARAEMIGVLDTMRYLAKSGRVPWVVHMAASLLRIRPVIAFDRGKPRPIARVRTLERGIEGMLRYLQRKAARPERMRVAVMHANAPKSAAELAERLRVALGPAELIVTEFTAVMGVHTGRLPWESPSMRTMACHGRARLSRPIRRVLDDGC